MFNHARTLLMNISSAATAGAQYIGYELIPENYKQLSLPTYLNTVRMQLFGIDPDEVTLNYRVAQYLNIIESTELQSYITALDSRLTYSSPSPQLSDKSNFVPTTTKIDVADGVELTVTGSPESPDVGGRSNYLYHITTSGGSLRVQRLSKPATDTTTAIVLTSGLSQKFTLDYSGYYVQVNSTADARWRIAGNLPLQQSIANIDSNLRSMGEPTLLKLFGSSPVEPYLTFKSCWAQHPELAYRLGGILLATIYRTEEVRNAS